MEIGGKRKLFRLENIESCWDFIEDNSIESFVELFCNETLSKIYRLMIFSSELKQNNIFLNEVKKSIDEEAIRRNFDCFQLVKQTSDSVTDIIYNQKQIIYLSDWKKKDNGKWKKRCKKFTWDIWQSI